MVDTNIWIDLHFGGLVADFLRLPFEFVCPDVIIGELQLPDGRELVRQGARELSMGPNSVRLVCELVERHPKPQLNDLFALVLAIELEAVLATGNEHLRQAAIAEGVRVVRTLGILQMMVGGGIILLRGQRTPSRRSWPRGTDGYPRPNAVAAWSDGGRGELAGRISVGRDSGSRGRGFWSQGHGPRGGRDGNAPLKWNACPALDAERPGGPTIELVRA